jgi:serine/threonine-protein kinase
MVASGAENDDSRRLAEATARVGTTLRSKWKLDSLLGLGGMAAVYSATHRNGMAGAVKILDPIVGRNDAMRERFLREGYLANSVNHPSAVLVLDDDTTEDGHVYLVMELLDGSTLEELAAESAGKLPAREVMDALGQVLDALSHAHARGIVHRDIKPDNLFLTTSGLLKILDFGIAGLLETERAVSITQTGAPMGTPAFMSPEQARGRSKLVDAQSDIYAVGATMFTLLSGQLVHGSDITISEYVAMTFTTQARSVRSVAPHLPEPIVAVVDRALRLHKAERWPSAADMLIALRAAYETVFGEPMAPAIPAAPVSRRSLTSLHEVKSLTPVSREQRDSANTMPPPPALAVSQARKAPSRGRAVAAIASLAVVSAIGLAAYHFSRATSRPSTDQPTTQAIATAPETPSVAADPPLPTFTAAVANVVKPIETQVVPVATSKPTTTVKAAPKATATASVAPSASAPPAPTVNVYDRRY